MYHRGETRQGARLGAGQGVVSGESPPRPTARISSEWNSVDDNGDENDSRVPPVCSNRQPLSSPLSWTEGSSSDFLTRLPERPLTAEKGGVALSSSSSSSIPWPFRVRERGRERRRRRGRGRSGAAAHKDIFHGSGCLRFAGLPPAGLSRRSKGSPAIRSRPHTPTSAGRWTSGEGLLDYSHEYS